MNNLNLTNLPDEALIRIPNVIALTGRGRSSIYAAIAANTFPRPIKIGSRAVAFKLGDIKDWISSKSLATKK